MNRKKGKIKSFLVINLKSDSKISYLKYVSINNNGGIILIREIYGVPR